MSSQEAFAEYEKLKAEAAVAETTVVTPEVAPVEAVVESVPEEASAAVLEDIKEETPAVATEPLLQKDKDELVRIIKEQQLWDAKRGTEIGELRKLKAEFEAKISTAKVVEVTEEIPEEAAYLEKVVETILEKKEKEQEASLQQREYQNYQQNQEAWKKLETRPELMAAISSELDKDFLALGQTQEERLMVMYKDPEWVSSKIMEHLEGRLVSKDVASSKAAAETRAVQERKKAAAVTDGRTTPPQVKMTKSVKEMSSAEYADYLRETSPQVFKT